MQVGNGLLYNSRILMAIAALFVTSACGPLLKNEAEGELPAEIIERSILPEPVELDVPEVIEPSPAAPVPAPRFVLEGRVGFAADGSTVLGESALDDGVVYFEPRNNPAQARPGRYQVEAVGKLFVPSVLVIPAGSEVEFLNNDEILHNVFSVSSSAQFDLGFYGQGESRTYVFEQPGRVQVNCSVHDSMSVDILVVDTAYFTQLDSEGYFRIDNLPAGEGELKIWHPQANIDSYALTIPVAGEQNYALKLTRPRIPTDNE